MVGYDANARATGNFFNFNTLNSLLILSDWSVANRFNLSNGTSLLGSTSGFTVQTGTGYPFESYAPTTGATLVRPTVTATNVATSPAVFSADSVNGGGTISSPNNAPAQFTGNGTGQTSVGSATSPSVVLGALIKGGVASSSPATGTTITMSANTDTYGVLGSTTLSTLTVLLPALTGTIGQDAEVDFQPAVTTLTVDSSTGTSVATTSATASSSHRFKTFNGTSWVMVQ